jgi:mono/diheme cytochrome c family protein
MPDYNRWRTRSRFRNLAPPLVLLAVVSAVAFTLARLHLAQPSVSGAKAGNVALGDPYRGETLFAGTCAKCHGRGGSGGVGPRLDGDRIPLSLVVDRIENGKGIMPPHLFSGRDERDVVAYVATLITPPGKSQ